MMSCFMKSLHLQPIYEYILTRAREKVKKKTRKNFFRQKRRDFNMLPNDFFKITKNIEQQNNRTLKELFKAAINYVPESGFAKNARDISVVIGKDVECGTIIDAIAACDALITKVDLFDIFESEKLGLDKKSMAFNLQLQSAASDVTDEMTDAVFEKVYEYDFTYSDAKTNKLAAELGWRLEYAIREGVKLSTNGYYREYLSYSEYVSTDLERDFNAVLRLDTNLWGDMTMGPYVQYRRARARGADVYGSNFVMGISFNYITSFGLITPTSAE